MYFQYYGPHLLRANEESAVQCVYNVLGFWITCQTCVFQTMSLYQLRRS